MKSVSSTQDFGNSWTNLTQNSEGRVASFVDFDWGVLLQPWSKYRERPADTTIFATAYEDPKHMKASLSACPSPLLRTCVCSAVFFLKRLCHENIRLSGIKRYINSDQLGMYPLSNMFSIVYCNPCMVFNSKMPYFILPDLSDKHDMHRVGSPTCLGQKCPLHNEPRLLQKQS